MNPGQSNTKYAYLLIKRFFHKYKINRINLFVMSANFFHIMFTITFPTRNATTCPFVDFVVLPPGHGRSVTDFWGCDDHEAQLRCPNYVWVVIEEDVVPGGALNLNSTNLPRPWSPWESSPSRKIPTVQPGIEPGTSWLVVRDSDHCSQ